MNSICRCEHRNREHFLVTHTSRCRRCREYRKKKTREAAEKSLTNCGKIKWLKRRAASVEYISPLWLTTATSHCQLNSSNSETHNPSPEKSCSADARCQWQAHSSFTFSLSLFSPIALLSTRRVFFISTKKPLESLAWVGIVVTILIVWKMEERENERKLLICTRTRDNGERSRVGLCESCCYQKGKARREFQQWRRQLALREERGGDENEWIRWNFLLFIRESGTEELEGAEEW